MVRPLVDDKVDRLEVYAPRGVQLTSTNRSRAYPKIQSMSRIRDSSFLSSDNGGEATPVPIPNTEVKLFSADGSWGLPPVRVGRCQAVFYWPLGQAVKTPPFHGGNTGSNPVGVTKVMLQQRK